MEVYSHASKYNEWKDIYNWGTCKAGREEYGTFLASHLTSGSRVINLNGQFGSGKTQFVRRLYTHLAKVKHPVVYFDVWESDFSNNPLAIICSELIQQLENVFDKEAPRDKYSLSTKAKRTLNALKKSLSTGLKAFAAASLVAGEPASSKISSSTAKVLDATPDIDPRSHSKKLIDSVKDLHIEAVIALKDIKEHITTLSVFMEDIYDLKVPIIIIIDELDRCRPTYAVEVLEVVKHFFETNGCTFLLSTNTDVLEQSIQSIYGSKFDSKHYLRRFFDIKVNLPQVSIENYMATTEDRFTHYNNPNVIINPYHENHYDNAELFACLFKSNDMELRDIDQVLSRYFATLDYINRLAEESPVVVNSVVLIAGLIGQHSDKIWLTERRNDTETEVPIIRTNTEDCQFNVESVVGSMFRCVSLGKSKTKYEGNGYSNDFFNGPVEMLALQTTDFSKINLFRDTRKHNISKELLIKIVSDFNNENYKYWLWEDHQKVIELSGHIE